MSLVIIYGNLVTISFILVDGKLESWMNRVKDKAGVVLWRLIKSSKEIITHYYQLDWDVSVVSREQQLLVAVSYKNHSSADEKDRQWDLSHPFTRRQMLPNNSEQPFKVVLFLFNQLCPEAVLHSIFNAPWLFSQDAIWKGSYPSRNGWVILPPVELLIHFRFFLFFSANQWL